MMHKVDIHTFLLVLLLGMIPLFQRVDAATAGEELLQRSLSYHDPSGVWRKGHLVFQLVSTNEEGRKNPVDVMIHIPSGKFQCRRDFRGSSLEVQANGSSWKVQRDGKILDDAGAEEFRWVRNYYEYLLGLPMKLTDRGTVIDPNPKKTTFNNRQVLSLRVTYKKEVGKDTWYFYFHPDTAALVGCRFHHDESKNDGEYLFFEGEVRANDLRLPATRKWYTNQEGKYLGRDTIQSIELRQESEE